MTFIINEFNAIYQKDTGGKPPEAFPDPNDLVKEGWSRSD